MFKIAVCDDIKATCDELKEIILSKAKGALHENISVDIFYSGDALISDIGEGNLYDLIFLDIELGGKINGVEIGHIIRDEMDDYITQIVYISSKNNYDRQLFDVQPLHFLQKPIDVSKLLNDIKLAIKISGKENKIFEFKNLRNTVKVPYKDILYFESKGREISLVSCKMQYKSDIWSFWSTNWTYSSVLSWVNITNFKWSSFSSQSSWSHSWNSSFMS